MKLRRRNEAQTKKSCNRETALEQPLYMSGFDLGENLNAIKATFHQLLSRLIHNNANATQMKLYKHEVTVDNSSSTGLLVSNAIWLVKSTLKTEFILP